MAPSGRRAGEVAGGAGRFLAGEAVCRAAGRIVQVHPVNVAVAPVRMEDGDHGIAGRETGYAFAHGQHVPGAIG